MTNWYTYKLGELINVQNGYAFKSGDLKESGVPVIKIKNIQPPNISFNEADCFPHEVTVKMNQFIVKKKDILISMTGSHVSQISSAVGKVGRYGSEKPALLNQRVGKLFSKDTEKLNDDFLYYYISRPEVQFELATNAGGSANQANISPQHIKELVIDVPSIEAQRQIAEILSALEDKIELNRRMNQTLEQMAQTLFRQYFVDVIDEENLPRGWRIGRLDEIAQNFDSKRKPLSSRQREAMKGTYPYYGATSLMDLVNDYLFDGTYILLGEDGTVVDKRGYPVLQYVWGKFWVNNHAHVLQGKSYISTNHLHMILQNTPVAHLVTGAVQPKINQTNLNNLVILIPDEATSIKFSKAIEPIYEKTKSNKSQNQLLIKTRDSLLPKLMSGEIDVMQTKPSALYEPELS